MKFRPALILGTCLLLTACKAYALPTTPSQTPTPVSPMPTGSLHKVIDPGQVTGTINGPCHIRDNRNLPDQTCTPGAYDPNLTAKILCAPGYSTSSYRPSESETEPFKYQVAYPAYGIPVSVKSELDHLVPLELGGSNDASNLWPEVGTIPNPKDHVETALHDAVCSGKVSLSAAQQAIAHNWETALAKLELH